MPLELEIDVPESRQVTLPDSVPVGKVKLTVTTPFDSLVPLPHTSDKFERERAAFFRLLPELLKTHRGQVVAIHNEQVIAVGDERRPVIDGRSGSPGGSTCTLKRWRRNGRSSGSKGFGRLVPLCVSHRMQ